jgi:hypothetical protein
MGHLIKSDSSIDYQFSKHNSLNITLNKMNSILDAVCNYVNTYNPLEPPVLSLLPTKKKI